MLLAVFVFQQEAGSFLTISLRSRPHLLHRRSSQRPTAHPSRDYNAAAAASEPRPHYPAMLAKKLDTPVGCEL
jgi:hypothetical protein